MSQTDICLGSVTPEEAGLSSRDVGACLRALDETGNEIHGFVAARDGKVFAESYLSPYAEDLPHTCHSLGKSYTCTALGVAMTEGLVCPDDRVVDLFAEEIGRFGARPDTNMQKIRLRDVMSMTNGMLKNPMMDEFWLENYLQSTVEQEPGTQFLYNSVGSCLLAAVVEKATGQSTYDYLNRKLFRHIGIAEDDLIWRTFANGYCAEPGVCATTRANLKLGMFYLHQGEVDGKQIVSREWMKEATTKQIDTGDASGMDDGGMGYGWQLWFNTLPGAYRFDGGQGQFCIVYPEKQMVIAIHEGGTHPNGVQKVLDTVHMLMRQAGDTPLPQDARAHADLQAYLRGRCVPDAASLPVPREAVSICGTYWVYEGIFNPWIEVSPGPADFYHLFYDPWISASVQKLTLDIQNDVVELCCNGHAVIRAALDGKWRRAQTESVMPPLGAYAATARFEDADTLLISLRWLNSWCCPQIRFTRQGACEMSIRVEKDMLHEGRMPFIREAKARKIR